MANITGGYASFTPEGGYMPEPTYTVSKLAVSGGEVTTVSWSTSGTLSSAPINGSSLAELYKKLARDINAAMNVNPLLGAQTAYGFENAPAV